MLLHLNGKPEKYISDLVPWSDELPESCKKRNKWFNSHSQEWQFLTIRQVAYHLRIGGWKRFLFIFGYPIFIDSYDGFNDKIFVDSIRIVPMQRKTEKMSVYSCVPPLGYFVNNGLNTRFFIIWVSEWQKNRGQKQYYMLYT